MSAVLTCCHGLKSPSSIKSTNLRKFVATVSQIVDLRENTLDWLAKHMGHDINVHRQYYWLHESTLELAKVSKVLLAVDDGRAGQFAGKNLDEITVKGLLTDSICFIDETYFPISFQFHVTNTFKVQNCCKRGPTNLIIFSILHESELIYHYILRCLNANELAYCCHQTEPTPYCPEFFSWNGCGLCLKGSYTCCSL